MISDIRRIQFGSSADNDYYIRAAAIPFGQVDDTSTSTAFTATVPGILELKSGVCMFLKNGVVTSAAGYTIDINELGPKPVYGNMAAATQSTTLFNVNYTLFFVYNEDRVNGGCWDAYYGYYTSSNSIGYQLRGNSHNLPVTHKTYRYRLFFTSANGTHLVPANASTSTNATAKRDVIQTPIDPFGEILYYSATTVVNAEGTPSATSLWTQYICTLGYSFNRTNAALVLDYPKAVYIKCAPLADGSAIIDPDTPYVLALPNTADGNIYIFLGVAYAATTVEVLNNHPIYYYSTNGGIQLWTGSAITATQPNVNSTDLEFPTSKAVYDAIQAACSSSLVYKGTITSYPSTTGRTTGDVYVVSQAFTYDSKSYEVGDMFIWNGSSWDVISGENQVTDNDTTLAWNTRSTIATVDGTDIHVTLPSNPSINSANLEILSTADKKIANVENESSWLLFGLESGTNDLYLKDPENTTFDILPKAVQYNTWTSGKLPQMTSTTGVITDSGYSVGNFVKYGDVLQPTNPFGGKLMYINSIDDALASAGKKYWVKVTTHKKVVDGVTYPHIKENASVTDADYYVDSPALTTTLLGNDLFNGSYEDGFTCPNDQYLKVHILFGPFTDSWTPSNGTIFSGYPYGNYYLSYYYTNTPSTAEPSYVRTYNKYASHGVGWKIINSTIFTGTRSNPTTGSGGNNLIEVISDNGNYQRSVIEFIIPGKNDSAANAVKLTEIEWKLTRPNLSLNGSTVTKFGALELFWDVTWYLHLDDLNFKTTTYRDIWTNVNKDTTNHTGTIGMSYLTAGSLVKADSSKELAPATKTTPTVLTSVTVSTSAALTGVTPSTSAFVTGLGTVSTSNFITGYTPSTKAFVTGYASPGTATVATGVTVNGAVTSVTPVSKKLTTTTITAVGGTVTASAASAETVKTVLTSLNPSTTTIYGVTSTLVTASKVATAAGSSQTIVSASTPTTSITTATYNSSTCTLSLGSGSVTSSVSTATITIPSYTITDVSVPVKASSALTVVTGFGTNGSTTITPYTFTTVTAATPASTGTVLATGGLSATSASSNVGATVVESVSSDGTSANLTVTVGTTTVLSNLGAASTAAAVTGLGNPSTAAAITALGTVSTSAAVTSLGTTSTAAVVTGITTATTTINNWS